MDAEASMQIDERAVDDVSNLAHAEWLALWGFRNWVASHRRGHSPLPLLSCIFSYHDVDEAALSIDAVLRLTCAATTRTVAVCCVDCPKLSADEHRILAAIGAAQQGDTVETLRLLRSWLPTLASQSALEMIVGLARAFARAGHVIRHDGGVAGLFYRATDIGGSKASASLH